MEGIHEIWNITWICLTLTNPQCAKLHNQVWGCCGGPFKYFSEEQCVYSAEYIAEVYYNEKKFKLEYMCDKVATLEPFVPTRRYRGNIEIRK
jgi:hypothetical protein